MTWWKPVSVTFTYFVVTPKGAVLKTRRVNLTWQKRLKAWAFLRAQRIALQAYLTRALWLD